jgi:hypothetical protein
MIDTAFIDPVLFVRWRARCEVRDVERIKAEIDAAYRKGGPRMVYVAIVPVNVPPPDVEVRAAILEGTAYATEHCRSVHVVIEGDGLRRALIRTVAAGLLLASRHSFEIHGTVTAALEQAASRGGFDWAPCYQQAKAAGLVDPVD